MATDETDATHATPHVADLLAELSVILFHHDPLGISFAEDSGEYVPVAELLLPHLNGCRSADAVAFGLRRVAESLAADLSDRGEAVQAAAAEIWSLIGD